MTVHLLLKHQAITFITYIKSCDISSKLHLLDFIYEMCRWSLIFVSLYSRIT